MWIYKPRLRVGARNDALFIGASLIRVIGALFIDAPLIRVIGALFIDASLIRVIGALSLIFIIF
jgi:hypothetical protein